MIHAISKIKELTALFLTCLVNSLIATPGRLLHLIVEMELELKSVQYIVFDEADR
jgi:superfamily II DNA/RNA helicase